MKSSVSIPTLPSVDDSMTRKHPLKQVLSAAALAPLLLAWTADARAENLVANPSAEHVTTDCLPEGWGLYLGAGAMKLSSTRDE